MRPRRRGRWRPVGFTTGSGAAVRGAASSTSTAAGSSAGNAGRRVRRWNGRGWRGCGKAPLPWRSGRWRTMGKPEDRPPFELDDRTAVWKYLEPWSDVWCAGDPKPVAADDPQRWVATDEEGGGACYPACPTIEQVFDHVPVRPGQFDPGHDPEVVWRLLADPEDESVGEAVEMRIVDNHTGRGVEARSALRGGRGRGRPAMTPAGERPPEVQEVEQDGAGTTEQRGHRARERGACGRRTEPRDGDSEHLRGRGAAPGRCGR